MQSSFSLTTDIAVSPEAAFAFVADPHKLIGGHPLIHALTLTHQTPAPDGTLWQHYEVKETLRMFGFLSVPNTYSFILKIQDGMNFVCDVDSGPVKLQNVYRVAAIPTGARVVEEVRITAPRLLMGYTLRTAKKAHEVMFQRVKEALENQA